MNTNCPHANRKHYAKNMCSTCYRKNGRTAYATECQHKNRILYSKGMCQTCYLNEYHRNRLNLNQNKKIEPIFRITKVERDKNPEIVVSMCGVDVTLVKKK